MLLDRWQVGLAQSPEAQCRRRGRTKVGGYGQVDHLRMGIGGMWPAPCIRTICACGKSVISTSAMDRSGADELEPQAISVGTQIVS